MGLLSDLRAFLQEIQAGRVPIVAEAAPLDLTRLRGVVLDAAGRDDLAASHLGDDLLVGADALIFEVAHQLLTTVGAPPQALAAELPPALAWALQAGERSDDPELAGLSDQARALWRAASAAARERWAEQRSRRLPSPRRYALELGLVRVHGGRPRLLPPGEVLLRLVGADATRWLLALELLSSVDVDDPWRGHPTLAARLLADRRVTLYDHERPALRRHAPWNNPALPRWTNMGLLELETWTGGQRPEEPDGGASYALSELGVQLLSDVLQEPDIPLKSLARALLEDISPISIDAVMGGRQSAGPSVVRHTRMVAHELRNRLVPVRYAFDKLWRGLPRDDLRVALHRQHREILDGLDRALRFVTDAARAVGAATEEGLSFNLAAALREACATDEVPIAIAVAIDDDAEAVHLHGPRSRLVMALLNILRNAHQAGGPAVMIKAAMRQDVHAVVLCIDDSGPGVPLAARDHLFVGDPQRPAGETGHGLPLVREVIEDEFAGAIHHEPSPLGGARMVLRLPIPR